MGKRSIVVTAECMAAIRGASTAPGGFHQTGKLLPNGDFEIEIDNLHYAKILSLCRDGLTASDAIMMAITNATGRIN
jgi:hypothetical protein